MELRTHTDLSVCDAFADLFTPFSSSLSLFLLFSLSLFNRSLSRSLFVVLSFLFSYITALDSEKAATLKAFMLSIKGDFEGMIWLQVVVSLALVCRDINCVFVSSGFCFIQLFRCYGSCENCW